MLLTVGLVGGAASEWRGLRGQSSQRPQLGMLGLLVAAQIHLALECPAAEVTSKGLETGVLARVRDQVGALAERLAAHLALVGFLA